MPCVWKRYFEGKVQNNFIKKLFYVLITIHLSSRIFFHLQVLLIQCWRTHCQDKWKNSWWWRLLAASSCPNPKTPCWETEARWSLHQKSSLLPVHSFYHSITLFYSYKLETFVIHFVFESHFCFSWNVLLTLENVMDVKRLFCAFQIIDPFVEVEIIGLPVDCCKEQTRVVDDNGKWQTKDL